MLTKTILGSSIHLYLVFDQFRRYDFEQKFLFTLKYRKDRLLMTLGEIAKTEHP